MSNKTKVSWKTYLQLVDGLFRKIKWDDEKFDAIVAINRGGLAIGLILSHKTRLHLEVVNKDSVINIGGGKILLVDDISDSGKTLSNVVGNLQHKNVKYKCATLHMKEDTAFVPDYYMRKAKSWIVYPYELE